MKRFPVFLIVPALILLRLAAPAHGAEPASVELPSLLSTLVYNYDGGRFSAEFSFIVYGLAPGDVTVVIENGEGEKVLERTIPCEETYTGEGAVACYLSSSNAKPAEPYQVQSGPHTLRLLRGGDEVYVLAYSAKVVDEYDYKNVYVTGDWDKLAFIDFSADPGMYVRVELGGPDLCGGAGRNMQVQLLRNGEFVARGHIEGNFFASCSTTESSFTLFSEDANHFTVWLAGKKQIFKEGAYELKVFEDGNVLKTYVFDLAEGRVTSTPPAGMHPGLQPGRIRTGEYEFVIYAK